jgi:Uma2 family endonuclease
LSPAGSPQDGGGQAPALREARHRGESFDLLGVAADGVQRTDRVELIRGEIIEMSPIGRRHTEFVINLTRLLVTRLDRHDGVVDGTAERTDVYRSPAAGVYRDVHHVAGDGTVTLQAFPDVALTFAKIFA